MPTTTGQQPWQELRVLRQKDGHTLTSLAQRCINPDTGRPMSVGYLSDLESGKREPNAAVTKRLAVALKVPVSVLAKDTRDDIDGAA